MESQVKAVIFNFSRAVLENKPRGKKSMKHHPVSYLKGQKLACRDCLLSLN